MEQLLIGALSVELCRTRRVGDKFLVLQKRRNNYGTFMELIEYGGGGRRRYVIIPEGRDSIGWGCCVSQLRRLVKHVEQTGIVDLEIDPTKGQPRVVEWRQQTFAEAVAGKGLTKEIEDKSKGGKGKIENKPSMESEDTRKQEGSFIPVDPADQAGLILAKNVMEGNVQALKEILVSFENEIDRYLKQIELGRLLSRGQIMVGTDTNNLWDPQGIREGEEFLPCG